MIGCIIKPFPNKTYDVVYADPPWKYKFTSPTGSKRPNYVNGVEDYYPTLTIDQIWALPVRKISNHNSVLFLWATNPLLPEAIETVAKWGFKYKTCLTWHKENCKGPGYWFRGHTEHLLLGVKGKVAAFHSLEHNIKKIPVGKHSEKPDYYRKLIESISPNSTRIELFARAKHGNGWDVWGNEAEGSVDK